MNLKIGEHEYETGTLSAMKQIHIARRLSSVVGEVITPETVQMIRDSSAVSDKQFLFDPMVAISLLLKAFGSMKDEDAEYIIDACSMVTKRVTDGKPFALCAPNGQLMFQDTSPAELLGIAANTVWDQMGNFIPALLAALPSGLMEAPST